MAALDNKKAAEKLKDQGNKEFAQGHFPEAGVCLAAYYLIDTDPLTTASCRFTLEELYTQGIALDSSVEALWSNRAATRLKLGWRSIPPPLKFIVFLPLSNLEVKLAAACFSVNPTNRPVRRRPLRRRRLCRPGPQVFERVPPQGACP